MGYLIDKLEKALALGGNTHDIADIVQMIETGRAQIWADDDGLLITEIHEFPRIKVLHFWLAAGEKDSVISLSHKAMEWGHRNGCRKATLAGRKGWLKVLADEGWQASKLTLLEREL